jgi:hypothetical protein
MILKFNDTAREIPAAAVAAMRRIVAAMTVNNGGGAGKAECGSKWDSRR